VNERLPAFLVVSTSTHATLST